MPCGVFVGLHFFERVYLKKERAEKHIETSYLI